MLYTDELPPELQIQLGRQLIEKGNSLRETGTVALEEALAAYGSAMALIEPHCDSPTSPFQDDLASACTNRGIALLGTGIESDIEEAIHCFDRALKLRSPLAASGEPMYKYNLAGVWINRGDALSRMGRPPDTAEAIRSYDEAIHAAEGLDLSIRAEFPRRMALAHLCRGTALARSTKLESQMDACRSFEASLAILGAGNAEECLMAAAAWVGKTEALELQGHLRQARMCALRAIEIARPLESGNRDAILVGLKSRLALCACTTRDLLCKDSSTSQKTAAVEAIDYAEDGLRLTLLWPADPAFAPLTRELFRFGSLAYAVLQPRFLREFLQEFLPLLGADSDPSYRVIATEAVNEGISRLVAKGIASAGLAGDDLNSFQELRRFSEQLGLLGGPPMPKR